MQPKVRNIAGTLSGSPKDIAALTREQICALPVEGLDLVRAVTARANAPVTTLVQISEDSYISDDGRHTLQREYGLTPNGNPVDGRWVLRKDGRWGDCDQYRHDLMEARALRLIDTPVERMGSGQAPSA